MSVAKQIKKTGKATIKGPEVKERKKFAPATKVEPSGKNYKRKNKGFDEDEELGEVPLKRDPVKKSKIGPSKRKVVFSDYEDDGNPNTVPLKRSEEDKKNQRKPLGGKRVNTENTNIAKFIDSILTKNYAEADKYIKQAVECKLEDKIKQELSTPLF